MLFSDINVLLLTKSKHFWIPNNIRLNLSDFRLGSCPHHNHQDNGLILFYISLLTELLALLTCFSTNIELLTELLVSSPIRDNMLVEIRCPKTIKFR